MTPEFVINFILIPLGIFFARILDQSFGTLRIMFIAKEKKLASTVLAFFEVLIWLIVIREVFKNMDNFVSIFAYAGGFAAGNLVGLQIHKMLALGSVLLRVITAKDASPLISALRGNGQTVTVLDADGVSGKVHVLFSVIKKRNLKKCLNEVLKHNPKAYYTIEEVSRVSNSLYPGLSARMSIPFNLKKAR
ncbi:MAG: DUF5698 domain-containing protein [Planctomycetes bacterium]|nr:DUF5698 domain-containing protein [Planctomycetota bacterium]